MGLRKPVLFLLFVTVLAPIVLYTDRLGSFTISSSRSEFIEKFSTLTFSSETRQQLNVLPQEPHNKLKEPIGLVFANNSSNSVLSSDGLAEEHPVKHLDSALEEFPLADSREHKTRVLSMTDEGDRSEMENPIKQVTDGSQAKNGSDGSQKFESTGDMKTQEERGKREKEEKLSEQISNDSSENLENVNKQRSAKTSAHVKAKPKQQIDQTVMPDVRVRQLKDQLIRARVYLGLSATRNNPDFIKELRLRMKEIQRALGDATKDSQLSRNAYDKLKAMEQVLAKGKQIQDDCATIVKKLRAILHSTEEQLKAHKKQTMFLTQLAAKTLPKGLHCLPLRLSTEYYSLNSSQQQFPNQEKLEDAMLYHYAIFSDNILATAVVVNSTISNTKDPENHVFHIVTDRLNYAAMRMWFLANPPDLKGKVNGAVETCGESFHRFGRYLNFSNPLISKNFDPHACGWAYGMNIFDLDEWKKQNITEVYHTWQKLNQDRQLWKLGTLPPGLITFWNRTFALDRSWHVLGLGYNPNINLEEIEQAAVIHYNGNMKPWLEIGLPQYRNYWAKFVNYDEVYLRECNINS